VTREEAMALLEFEPGEVAVHTCACCGMDSETVHGFLYGPGGETTVFFAGYTRGHPERWASMVLSVGGWGDDTTPADRRAIPLQVHVFEGALRFTFVPAEASPWNGEEILGAMASVDDLTDDERARYRSIARAAVQLDLRVAAFFAHAWRVGLGSRRGRILT